MIGISDYNTAYIIAYSVAKEHNEKYVVMQLEDGSYSFQQNPKNYFKSGMEDILGNKILCEI